MLAPSQTRCQTVEPTLQHGEHIFQLEQLWLAKSGDFLPCSITMQLYYYSPYKGMLCPTSKTTAKLLNGSTFDLLHHQKFSTETYVLEAPLKVLAPYSEACVQHFICTRVN
jgi:hypothetical protein